ncbi:MAG TPA: FAD-dependent oxidoreductase [Pyrinomonadaceae bacterium]|nr:FAD-dependent oxidoreductase [Pyrinomonadaceae bacterium]
MENYDIVVIGGGSAGLVAAVGAAQLGARTLLVERRALGGDCLFTGCVPSKALIASARFAALGRRAAEFGFEPGERGFLGGSFAAVTRRVARVVGAVAERDAPEVFERYGVEILFGTPRFVSPREIEVEPKGGGPRRSVRARRFCVSTGSRPAVPPVEGLVETGFLTNEEVFDLAELPRSLLIVGGGPVGVELGQAFARFGSRVTLVQRAPRLLAREDEEVSEAVAGALRAEGVEVLTGAEAVRARRAGGDKFLTVRGDGGERELRAAEILVAAGRRPNVEGLNLEAAGVESDGRRVRTDAYLRTTARTVYAAGDVTGRFLFTHAAAYEAALVVRNALFFGPLRRRADFRVMPWAVFTEPEVARVGLTEREARDRYGGRVRVYRVAFAENDRAQAEGETGGFAKFVCAGRGARLVGAHLVGPHAGELIHEVVLAMKEGLGLAALGGLVHVYPTLSQVSQQAGVAVVLEKLSSPLARRWMRRYLALWRWGRPALRRREPPR